MHGLPYLDDLMLKTHIFTHKHRTITQTHNYIHKHI